MMNFEEESKEEINHRFTYHAPGPEQVQTYEGLREAARKFAFEVCGAVPPSGERSAAIMKIEEAVFWANAGIARRS